MALDSSICCLIGFFVLTIVLLTSLFVETGPLAIGWTIYPPLSALWLFQDLVLDKTYG